MVVVNQVVLFKGATSRYFPSFYRLKLVFGSTEFLNDVLVLLFKTILIFDIQTVFHQLLQQMARMDMD